MKLNFQRGLTAFIFFCILSSPVFAQSLNSASGAQSFLGEVDSDVPAQKVIDDMVSCTSIELSDPAVYTGEHFRVFVKLKNPGKQTVAHKSAIYRKDALAADGKVLLSSKQLMIKANEETEISFTLAPENLLVKGQAAPDSFVFVVEEREIKVNYVR